MSVYLEALGDLSEANPAFAGAIKMIKNGLSATYETNKLYETKQPDQPSKEDLDTKQNDSKSKPEDSKKTENLTEEEAKAKVKTLERVIKEIKK